MTTKAKQPRPDYLRVLKDPQAPPQLGLPGMPAPVESKPDQVEGLASDEQKVWDELLVGQPENVVRELNRSIYETLVRATCMYRDAAKQVAKYGSVIKSPSGYPIQSPYVSIMNKQQAIMLKCSNELGFTMLGRSRVKGGNKSKSKANPFEGLKTLGE